MRGSWNNQGDKYLGFVIPGEKSSYGWIRLNVTDGGVIVIKDWAYIK